MTDKTTEALKLAEEALDEAMTYTSCESWSPSMTKDCAKALAAIREVLAKPEITTPDVCGEVCARAKLCYGCGKALDEANAKHEPLCEDEGCPHHGTPHICFSDPSVLDKPFACETGECPDKSLCAGACECLYKAEPVKQEPVMDYEHICALRESEQIKAGDSYFFARPENDTPTSRKMFFQGFERGFHKGLKYAAQVSAKREWVDLTDDEIWDCDVNTANARRVIAAFKEKNK